MRCDVPAGPAHPSNRPKKDGKFVFDLKPIKRQLLCTPELEVAVKHGYIITHVYKTITFKKTKELFKKYMRKCVKGKIEANGFSGTDEERAEYVEAVEKQLGVTLGPLKKNAGKKAVYKYKLSCNSLWGKMGQRPNMPKNHYTKSIGEFQKFVRQAKEGKINILEREHCGDCVFLTYEECDESHTSLAKTNIALCAMITSHARCRLYDVMGKLGERMVYGDTDSVYYETWPGAWEPETGTMLGMWEPEFEDGTHWVEMAAIAPKTYAYRTNKGAYSVKSKGMTLNKRNYDVVNFGTYKEMVMQQRKTLVGDQMVFAPCHRQQDTSVFERGI
jgi:hypothetical protein